jgi:hypothetical protein
MDRTFLPWRTAQSCTLLLIVLLAFPLSGDAYSVLSHEATVDFAWATNIVPLLKKRFPEATADDLRQAHAFAYGGAIIQDMGYYPVRQQVFQQPHSLRAQRRFHSGVAARCS